MKTDFLTVVVLFGIIILLTIWFSSTPAYIPYSDSMRTKYASYEAFQPNPLEYSSAKDNIAIDGCSSNYLISPQKSGPKAVSGFNGFGVFNTPDVASKEVLDIYSQAQGSLTATGYGYFNSMGPLVLDDKMKNMLSMRGGNATNKGTIGGSQV
jgi:hypothetical protein